MNEASVTSSAEIPSLVSARYGIEGIGSVSPVEGGSANCWRIETAARSYLLKEFQSSYRLSDVAHEPATNDFLRGRGIPTALFFSARSGETSWVLRDRVFLLQEFVDGRIYRQNTAPSWLVRESAVMLGRIHAALFAHAPMKREFPASWFTGGSSATRSSYASLLDRAAAIPDEPAASQIRDDLRFKLAALSAFDPASIDPDRLTICNSHGDYHVQQIVTGGSSIRAVIDFSSACALPVVWEIARSYTYADPACAGGLIVPANLIAYLRHYLEGAPLTPYDIRSLPRLYYLQLLRSRYGYTQYLIDRTVNREELLQFASWRTSLCRWLSVHLDDLTRELLAALC